MSVVKVIALILLIAGATLVALLAARGGPVVLREIFPPRDYFRPLVVKMFDLNEGVRETVQFSAKYSGSYAATLRLVGQANWSPILESSELRLAIMLKQAARADSSTTIRGLSRFSDAEGRGYILRYFRTPEDFDVNSPVEMELSVEEVPRMAGAAPLRLVLEIRKISDL